MRHARFRRKTGAARGAALARLAIGAALTALAIAAATCDDFSLDELLLTPEEAAEALALSADSETVPQLGTVALSAIGGTPPYSFLAPTAVDPGMSGDIGHMSESSYVAGEVIGRMLLIVRDSVGDMAFTYVDVVPVAPVFSDGCTRVEKSIALEWSHEYISMLSGFRLERSIDSADFVAIAEYNASTTGCADSVPNKNSLLVYRLYALADDYESTPAEKTFIAP